MPYIKPEARQRIAYNDGKHPETAGELNYVLYKTVLQYIKDKGECYQTCCDIEGVLGHMAKELYRRKVGPYEDRKIKQNGDVTA